jgi:hypothetical protein
MSFVTTISRVISGHCSIRAHLERFRIVGDPICVCMIMMNYETVDHIIWECGRFESTLNDLMLEVQRKLEPSYLKKIRRFSIPLLFYYNYMNKSPMSIIQSKFL